MKITKEQIDELKRLAEESKTDPVVKDANLLSLIMLLFNEAKRLFDEGGGTFSKELLHFKIDTMPWKKTVPFYVYLDRLRNEAPKNH